LSLVIKSSIKIVQMSGGKIVSRNNDVGRGGDNRADE
jgi:hypothetical protein